MIIESAAEQEDESLVMDTKLKMTSIMIAVISVYESVTH